MTYDLGGYRWWQIAMEIRVRQCQFKINNKEYFRSWFIFHHHNQYLWLNDCIPFSRSDFQGSIAGQDMEWSSLFFQMNNMLPNFRQGFNRCIYKQLNKKEIQIFSSQPLHDSVLFQKKFPNLVYMRRFFNDLTSSPFLLRCHLPWNFKCYFCVQRVEQFWSRVEHCIIYKETDWVISNRSLKCRVVSSLVCST